MKPVVVFDVDDTLYLERDYVRSGFDAVSAWAEKRFSVGIAETAWRLFIGGTRGTTISDAFAEAGRVLSASELAEAIGVYRGHVPSITMCGDAAASLELLRADAHIAVVTDGPLESQQAKADALGLADVADPIVLTAAHGAGWQKPGSQAFAFIQKIYDVTGDRCTYVADNPAKDFAGPKQLGWNTVRVSRPLGLHSSEPGRIGEIDVTVESLDRLPSFVF